MSITAFGPSDNGSVQQLERCIGVSGDDAAGVLCADHHLGYGMPIGVGPASCSMPASK